MVWSHRVESWYRQKYIYPSSYLQLAFEFPAQNVLKTGMTKIIGQAAICARTRMGSNYSIGVVILILGY